MRRIVLALAVVLSGVAGAAQFSSLEERMSEAEFRAAGLDRLSPEELESLNAWIRARVAAARGSDAASTDRTGFRASGGLFGADSGERRTITARVNGNIDGIAEGRTIQLENGQVWQVTEGSIVLTETLANPVITIEPALLGSWLLKVEGYNRSVRVTRIR
jgi:hypothetical protein